MPSSRGLFLPAKSIVQKGMDNTWHQWDEHRQWGWAKEIKQAQGVRRLRAKQLS